MFLSAVSATLIARINFNGFNIANISTIRKHSEFLERRCCSLASDNILSCVDFLSRWSGGVRLSSSLQPVYHRAHAGSIQVEFELNNIILGIGSLQVLETPIPIIFPPTKSSPGTNLLQPPSGSSSPLCFMQLRVGGSVKTQRS
jgi:hypothetical protein